MKKMLLKDVNVIKKNFDFDFSRLSGGLDVRKIIIHHTGNANNEDTNAEEIHYQHRHINGWAGIGYHYVIRKNGKIEQGRPLVYIGAHCPGQNDRSIGVHLSGNFELGRPTEAQLESLALLCGGICNTYALSPYTAIQGHCDYLATACPGTYLYRMLPTIRGKADFYMQNGW